MAAGGLAQRGGNDMGRVLFAVLLVIFIGLQYKLWFDRGSVPRARALEQDLTELNAKNEEAKRRNAVLEADVRDLERAGEAIEERARSELGMVRKGETLIQLREAPARAANVAAAPARADTPAK